MTDEWGPKSVSYVDGRVGAQSSLLRVVPVTPSLSLRGKMATLAAVIEFIDLVPT